jgi:sec-independent protein translocase protein TatA
MELGMLQMNIGASEWGIIFLFVMLLLVGSNRFSGLARIMGRAVAEYDNAREMIRNKEDNSQSKDSILPLSSIVPEIKGPVASEREKLKIIAKALDIEESGLDDDQLRSLISQKIQKR